ncbi:winged helix-turn-helix transcriptional regulator [Agrobacterium vitis]|uniref:MarR family winged helix-turn-helix transcriptional regulator n=1 Tax=Allorhizobium ampelinum TaxID=3025782 RepID=UPI00300CDEAC|nr:winged helix-turn-helix transcriptional regulator [Allorhizobium ampelinum]
MEQYRVLQTLKVANGIAMGDLAARVFVDSPTLTKIIDKMVASADVYRGPDPRDRRRVLIFLSDKGAARFEAAGSVGVDIERQFAELIGHEQADFLRHLRAILVKVKGQASSVDEKTGSQPLSASDPPVDDRFVDAACRIIIGLECVRDKWNPVFPNRQTKTTESRVCLVQSEPDRR